MENSRDPECDAARALVAKGITGKLTIDGKTGKPRTIIDIEKAAQLTVSEVSRDGLRLKTGADYQLHRPAPKRTRRLPSAMDPPKGGAG